jgi:hypothetical protein
MDLTCDVIDTLERWIRLADRCERNREHRIWTGIRVHISRESFKRRLSRDPVGD